MTITPFVISEKYISPWVLPKEQIIGWVKWQPSIRLDHIIIRTEKDVLITRALNVNYRILATYKPTDNLLRIGGEGLQIKGFVGFEAVYEVIPNEERSLKFVVEIVSEEQGKESVELITTIIRPIINIKQISNNEILITKERIPTALSVLLENKGKGDVKDPSPYIDVKVAGQNLQVKKEIFEEPHSLEERLFVKERKKHVVRIAISGVGLGVIRLGFEYKDRMKNKYKTHLTDVIINAKEKQRAEILVNTEIEDKPMMNLEPLLIQR